MAIWRCQVTIPTYTLLPKDVLTNTFHFATDDVASDATVANVLAVQMETFYETVYGNAGTAAAYLSSGQWTVDCFKLSDAPPRLPQTRLITVTRPSPSNSAVPTECAVTASFHSAPLSGAPQARRRNRIFIGGLGSGTINGGTASTYPMINGAFITSINNAMIAMRAANTAANRWVVYSPTNGVVTDISGGWVDNSPDTQRRRGIPSTTRTVWTA